MRISSNVKIHGLRGQRLPYLIREAETRENEIAYLEASGILVADGEGAIYWIDIMPTSDGGSGRIYDDTAASGDTLETGYAAKALDGQLKEYNPPIPYSHGVYATLTTALIRISYKPFARNLRCMVIIFYPPGTLNLITRLTVYYAQATSNLVVSVVSRKVTLHNFISSVIVAYANATLDLVIQIEVRPVTGKDLINQIIVRQETVNDFRCQVDAQQVV